MKALMLILILPACTQDIAGLTRNERLTLYSTALLATGHPEASNLVYALRRPVTQAKQPVKVEP